MYLGSSFCYHGVLHQGQQFGEEGSRRIGLIGPTKDSFLVQTVNHHQIMPADISAIPISLLMCRGLVHPMACRSIVRACMALWGSTLQVPCLVKVLSGSICSIANITNISNLRSMLHSKYLEPLIPSTHPSSYGERSQQTNKVRHPVGL